MPAMPPPITDERAGLKDYLAAQQYAFHAIAFGLTDEQARQTPTVSALSIGGVIKHVTQCQRSWMRRVSSAPELAPTDLRSQEEQQSEYQNEFVMREDETLADLLAAFDAGNKEALALIDAVDLGAAVPVPPGVPWFPQDVPAWSMRWVLFHLIEELSRHAGQADIIRESIDGATLYELLAGVEDWEPTPWLTPWGKTPVS
ncbi:DinB family protein [Mycolicibacterium mengxianglii]|uniref:DinB family protein n=1 Tax=Mycolicibacterium mengxianglii TaxID=2736649 RepID=UPI0018EF0DA2|nr:DinB family protein [Mycolicibacterium mengxianglii]